MMAEQAACLTCSYDCNVYVVKFHGGKKSEEMGRRSQPRVIKRIIEKEGPVRDWTKLGERQRMRAREDKGEREMGRGAEAAIAITLRPKLRRLLALRRHWCGRKASCRREWLDKVR